MDESINQALSRALPATDTTKDRFPRQLTGLAASAYSRSKNSFPLGKDEAARADLCAHFAINTLKDKLDLSKPVAKKVPMKEKKFLQVLQDFTEKFQSSPSSSPQKSPKKSQSSLGPQTPTRSRIRSQQDAQLNFDENASQFASKVGTPTTTPQRTAADSRVNTPSRKTPARGRDRFGKSPSKSPAKKTLNNGPTMQNIGEKCEGLGFGNESMEAVSYGYRHYNKQIKEKWLFLGGLMCVVAKRAEPTLINANPKRTFYSVVSDLLPQGINESQIREWAWTVEKMVGEHSWMKRITVNKPRTTQIKRTENMLGFGTDQNWEERMLKRIKV